MPENQDQDPELHKFGTIGFSVRYDAEGNLVSYYIADWLPEEVRQKLRQFMKESE
jgi:hypothetical protein